MYILSFRLSVLFFSSFFCLFCEYGGQKVFSGWCFISSSYACRCRRKGTIGLWWIRLCATGQEPVGGCTALFRIANFCFIFYCFHIIIIFLSALYAACVSVFFKKTIMSYFLRIYEYDLFRVGGSSTRWIGNTTQCDRAFVPGVCCVCFFFLLLLFFLLSSPQLYEMQL